MTRTEPGTGRSAPPTGAFVAARGNGLGTGKLVAVDGRHGVVEYFDVPVADGRVERKEALSALRHVVPESQTRVWWHDGARWHVGRVEQPPRLAGEPYLVAFPDGKMANLSGDDLYVRWSRPLVDPVRLLAARTVETRFFHIHRSRFLATLFEQRAASEGLGGILSSSVELHLHQVAAARRVLSDPVQRYLLADEVGLGKTIEAGMVIRQVLIDEEEPHVLVLAPDALTRQWEDELNAKFRVDWFDGTVEVRPHGWLSEGVLPASVDLLVVDEVHRLTTSGSAETSVLYECLRPLAVASPRLLLVSATPVRSNEDVFLRMLHLLDPELYPLDDLQKFRERVERRDDVADAVTSLADDTPLFLLRQVVKRLRATFPEDVVLGGHLDELAAAIDADDELRGAAAARAVKTHVSETYRLHRRLIRTRRNERLQATFPVRLRCRGDPWTLLDPDPARGAVVSALDAFRAALAAESALDQPAAVRLVAARLSAARPAIRSLALALEGKGGHDLDGADAALAVAIATTSAGRALRSDLEAALAREATTNRLSAMVDWAWAHVGKGVTLAACTDFSSVARAALEAMRDRYGPHRVAALLSGTDADELSEELERARDNEACVLLVCDRVAEEGWNLQFVDVVLHLDLPWSANRLEQRLGRFDRFAGAAAGRAPIRSITVADAEPHDRVTGAWRRVLDEGFGAFDRSTASLQYVLPQHEDGLVRTTLDQGFGAMAEGLGALGGELKLVRRRIDGQDLFDSVDDTDDDEHCLAALQGIDDEAGKIRGAFDGWIRGALRFTSASGSGGVRYGISKQAPPLVPASALGHLGLHRLKFPYLESRRQAVRKPGSGFLRWGEPLVDRFLEQAERDDRGHAFAVRRRHPNLPRGTPFQPIFRFDVKVSASLDTLEPVAAAGSPERAALERRLQRYLGPWIEAVWLSPRCTEVPEQIRALLEDHRDLDENLAKLPDEFDELIAGLDWPKLCEATAAAAVEMVAGREQTMQRLTQAMAAFRRDVETARSQEAARRAHLGSAAGGGGEGQMEQAMEKALATPALQVESCGAVFLGPPE